MQKQNKKNTQVDGLTQSDGMSAEDDRRNRQEQADEPRADDAEVSGSPKKKRNRKKIAAIVGAVIVVLLIAAGGTFAWAYAKGALYPATAAAKYGLFDYLDEEEVTDYIMTYKEQMGYGEATDDEWASFLATYNLTPERLRLATIEQLLSDHAVQAKCDELGITASDEEVDATIATLRSMYGLADDDEAWQETLELYGQSEEGLRETYRLQLLKSKLCTAEVETPEPTDDEVVSYLVSFAQSAQAEEASEASSSEEYQAIMNDSSGSIELKHSYCFVLDASGDEVSLDDSNQLELIKDEFVESGTNLETFVTLLSLYCNDEECVESNGAMGWNADTSEYSDNYIRELENTAVGGVSNVFTDGDTVCFIWVDQSYEIPYDQEAVEALDLDAMPSSLFQYFSDCEAYVLWSEASDEYLSNLLGSLDVTIYEMPADVPYNVDMSAYLVAEDEESDDADDAADDGDAAAEDADDASGDGEEGETTSAESQ